MTSERTFEGDEFWTWQLTEQCNSSSTAAKTMKQEFVDNWRIALKASAKSPGKRWLAHTCWFSKPSRSPTLLSTSVLESLQACNNKQKSVLELF